jgi:hypothetical protein
MSTRHVTSSAEFAANVALAVFSVARIPEMVWASQNESQIRMVGCVASCGAALYWRKVYKVKGLMDS